MPRDAHSVPRARPVRAPRRTSTGAAHRRLASGEGEGQAHPWSSARWSIPSRIEPAEASVDAHRLCLGLEKGWCKVADALQTEAPHSRLVAAEVGVRPIGWRIERNRLPLHL